MSSLRSSKPYLLLLSAATYILAMALAWLVLQAWIGSIFERLLVADLAATLVIFTIGWGLKNSSLYDPYWSLAPPLLLLGYAVAGGGVIGIPRGGIVALLVFIWAWRLTFNCLRRWQDLAHEDFRYIDKRAQFGRLYPLVDLFGIQLFPTLLVFLGCLPFYAIFVDGGAYWGLADFAALFVTGGAIAIEWHADRTLWKHRQSARSGEVLTAGLWGRARYPNYFGELGFWGGLWLFAMAVDIKYWWTGIGFVAMVALFRFISIPLMEKRKIERHKDYEALTAKLPLLIPWPRNDRTQSR